MKILADSLIRELCSCTDTSSTLLTELRIQGIIGDVLISEIKAEPDPKGKAFRLYTFLKNSALDEALPKVLNALKDSANAKAFKMLESAPMSQESDQQPNNVTPGAPSSISLTTGDVKVSKIAGILSTDDTIIDHMKEFYVRFPKVNYGDVKSYLDKFTHATTTSTDVIKQVVSTWKGRNGNDATVAGLVAILEKEDDDGLCFMDASRSLKKVLSLNCSIVNG